MGLSKVDSWKRKKQNKATFSSTKWFFTEKKIDFKKQFKCQYYKKPGDCYRKKADDAKANESVHDGNFVHKDVYVDDKEEIALKSFPSRQAVLKVS